MPETPDFDQIARQLLSVWVEEFQYNSVATANLELTIVEVAEQLRHVWNARGAADIAKLENRPKMNRRDFIGLVPAAFVATNVTVHGESVPEGLLGDPRVSEIPPASSGVIGRKLYRTLPGDMTTYILIATAGPDDHAWRYLTPDDED